MRVEFRFLSGSKYGQTVSAADFPFRIGRSADADLSLPDAGVFEFHSRVVCISGIGFRIESIGEALVRVGGFEGKTLPLRDGSIVELGAVRIRFAFSPVNDQRSGIPDVVVWFLVVAVTLLDFGLLSAW